MVFFIIHQPVISKYDDKYFIIEQNIMTILLVLILNKNRAIDMKRVNLMYFSPTATTKTIVEAIGNRLVDKNGIEKGISVDFTLPTQRENGVTFSPNDILLIGVPVYAGRVPYILLSYLNTIKSNNTLAIPVVLYGNRDYDDALLELNDILIENGFSVIAGGAFIGEHSFSNTLAKDRPDETDLSTAKQFADNVYKKIEGNSFDTLEIKGNRPYRAYNKPKTDENKTVESIKAEPKVEPKTDDNCIDCKICAEVCPMACIDYNDVTKIIGTCIKCGACVKLCPTSSKYFDNPDYLKLKHLLEEHFKERKEPELYV